jgi:transposase-like protein
MTSPEYILLDASQADIWLVDSNVPRPYIYVAIDESGKILGMKTYDGSTSHNAISFLKHISRRVPSFRKD